jgi:hypothetical protein
LLLLISFLVFFIFLFFFLLLASYILLACFSLRRAGVQRWLSDELPQRSHSQYSAHSQANCCRGQGHWEGRALREEGTPSDDYSFYALPCFIYSCFLLSYSVFIDFYFFLFYISR